jgi:hypothetical protein
VPVETPAPAFTTQPSISPTSGTAGSTVYAATPGTVSNGSVVSRAWLLNGTAISNGVTAVPASSGTLTYQETASGPGGTTTSTVQVAAVTAATVTPAPAPSFTSQPSISPNTGTVGTTTFTANSGNISNGSVTSRSWTINGTVISTGLTASPASSGTLTYQETATGPGGTMQSTVQQVTVATAAAAAPAFTSQPTVSPSTGTAGTTTYTATPGAVTNGTITSRAWALNGSTISTGLTATPASAGTLTYQEFATGAGGSASSSVLTRTVSAATPTLALSPASISIASSAAAGTTVSNITNVPAGVTPTVTPNDGRLVIAGDASAGWKVVVGMSALSAGTINFSVAATGATGASGVVTVSTAQVGTLVAPPTDYPWTPPVNVYRTGSGTASTFSTDYNPATTKALVTPQSVFYVAKTTGNNNNDGLTMATAFRSLALAAQMIMDTGQPGKIIYEAALPNQPRIIYASNGTQARSGQATNNATWPDNMGNTTLTVSMIFEPSVVGGIADSWTVHGNSNSSTWAATSDANIYSTSGGFGGDWFDYGNQTPSNAPRRMAYLEAAPADTANPWPEINALWNKYANLSDDGGPTYALGVIYYNPTDSRTYMRTSNNRKPDALVWATQSKNGSGVIAATNIAPLIIWNDGLGFGGGASSNAAWTFNSPSDPSIVNQNYNHNARYMGGAGGGSFQSNGPRIYIVNYRCTASGSGSDGFNYHSGSAYATAPKVIEIDCDAHWCGWATLASGTTSNNSTTVHEYVQILRVNFKGYNAQHRALFDIGDSRGWNLGCASSTRDAVSYSGTDTSTAIANDAVGWYDACRVLNNGRGEPPQYPYRAGRTAGFRYANFALAPTTNSAGNTGTFVQYDPTNTTTPVPAPAFTTQPSISPTSGTAGSTTFTATDGVASNASSYTRRWLLSGTAIGTGTTVALASDGSLVLEVTATGSGGSTIANSPTVTVAAATSTPTPTPTPTNLATNPQAFENWQQTGFTVTPNVTGTADRLTEGATGNTVVTSFAGPAIVSGTTYTLAFDVTYENLPFVQIHVPSGIGAGFFANFDIQTGVVGLAGSGTTSKITNRGNGVYRIEMTFTATTSANSQMMLRSIGNATAARASTVATSGRTVLANNAQFVAGTSATAYA